MKKRDNIIIIIIFLCFIGAISISGIILRDKTFSENENRYLETLPKLSISDIIEGNFESNFESYISDQIVGRNKWIQIKTSIKKTILNKDINGVYIGKNGYYIEKITEADIDDDNYEKNTDEVVTFSKKISKSVSMDRFFVMLIPTAGTIMSDKLPLYASPFDENARYDVAIKKFCYIKFIDIRQNFLTTKNVQTYYKTDHHWTTDAAFLAYQKWCKIQRIKLPNINQYYVKAVTKKFRGTLYSKVLDDNSAFDNIKTYSKKKDVTYKISLDGKSTNSFYKQTALRGKDKYSVFFGGNYGIVKIISGTKNGKHLLIIKDSYANCFVPFLAGDYEQIAMLDLRYYNGNVLNYAESNHITDVLVLYSMSNFIADKNLEKLNYKWNVLN